MPGDAASTQLHRSHHYRGNHSLGGPWSCIPSVCSRPPTVTQLDVFVTCTSPGFCLLFALVGTETIVNYSSISVAVKTDWYTTEARMGHLSLTREKSSLPDRGSDALFSFDSRSAFEIQQIWYSRLPPAYGCTYQRHLGISLPPVKAFQSSWILPHLGLLSLS